jgi:hypothetical protein
MRIDPRLIGFTAHRFRGPLSKPTLATSSIRRSLDPIRIELILPRATPLQSPFVRAPRRSPCDARLHLPLGFVPSSRHHSRAATNLRGASHAPLRSVLRLSQPLDGLFRARACGLIPSRSHVQGPLSFRGFSPVAATHSHRMEPASLPLFHRRSCSRSDFRRLTHKSTREASRLRGFHLRQAAFLESGYSPRPKPLPSSNFMLLQGLALSTTTSALTVVVRSLCCAFELPSRDGLSTIASGCSPRCHLRCPPGQTKKRSSCSPPSAGSLSRASHLRNTCPLGHGHGLAHRCSRARSSFGRSGSESRLVTSR